MGHLAQECPTPEGSQDAHICRLCGGTGHVARGHEDATKGKGKGDGTWKGKVKGKGNGTWKGKGKGIGDGAWKR